MASYVTCIALGDTHEASACIWQDTVFKALSDPCFQNNSSELITGKSQLFFAVGSLLWAKDILAHRSSLLHTSSSAPFSLHSKEQEEKDLPWLEHYLTKSAVHLHLIHWLKCWEVWEQCCLMRS